MSRSKRLRQLLSSDGIHILPGVYDCIGAKIAEQVGFDVVFTSGFGISGSTLGKPDYGFLTATEMLHSVSRIANSVKVPLVADIDTGYGNPLNVYRTVSDVVREGVAGIILEDQVWPKRCGHMAGKKVIPTEEHVAKIQAAVEARGDSELVIIGRTDARAVNGLEDAISRGRAFAEAGADVIFVEAPQSIDELRTIAQELSGLTLFANMIEGGRTPYLPAEELAKLGFKLVVYPLSGLFAATAAITTCLRALKQNGSTEGAVEMVSFQDFESLVEIEHYREQEKKFL